MNFTCQNVPFISQRSQDIFQDISCGAACLMMMLKYHKIEQYLFSQLCSELKLDIDPVTKGYPGNQPFGCYPEDIHRFMISHRYIYRTHFYKNEFYDALKNNGPIMVMISAGTEIGHEEGHWILLIGIENNKFIYLDPWQSEANKYHNRIDQDQSYKDWTGIACQIINNV